MTYSPKRPLDYRDLLFFMITVKSIGKSCKSDKFTFCPIQMIELLLVKLKYLLSI